MTSRIPLAAGWLAAVGAALAVRAWNALEGPLMWGYDAWGHVAYVLFLDVYRGLPWADQGWSYYHPPLHYALGSLLARTGNGEVLMRGLALLGSAASLGIAALAAWLVRAVAPERRSLALLAFVAVAFLPVHLFAGAMPGNEMVLAFLIAASITAFIANERRARPSWRGDLLTGLLLGLALLTKHSGLLPLFVVLGSLALRPLRAGAARDGWPKAAARGALIGAVVLLMTAPYYQRNLRAFGTVFPSNSDFPLVGEVERDQPPGERFVLDYVRFPLEAFSDPNPLAPHLLRSVWASVYLNVWADTQRESDVARALEAEREARRSTRVMALLGLLPSAAAIAGAAFALGDVRRRRRQTVYIPLLLLCGISLAAFVRFTWGVPTWAAVKASYLLVLSIPYALFLARSAEYLAERRHRWQRALLPVGVSAAALGALVVGTDGVVLPRRADAPATGAVRFYFGEYDAARRVYGRLIAGSPYPVPWLDNLAAVELADGRAAQARRLYGRAVALSEAAGRGDPYRRGRLAVAMALTGDLVAARDLFDAVLAEQPLPELLANRGAVRAADGNLAGAEADLRAALELTPELVPAWRNLAVVLGRAGRAAEAERTRERAERQACRSPRGYPHGVGTGEVLEWGVGRRWLLLLDAARSDVLKLRAALPAFYREACHPADPVHADA